MSVSTPPPPYRCPDCGGASENPRNLAVFIDGTSNRPGEKNTNVVKLRKLVKLVREGSEPEQRQHYLKGIGACDTDNLPLPCRVGKAIYSSFEMALAWNVEKNVKDAYTWLAENYQEGDRIYLFGFSRGAYQVRTLATMIHEVGLVKEKDDIDSAYGHYLSIDPYNPETRQKAMIFRKESCRPGVRIHFVGVWDTVSSLGLIKKDVHIAASTTVTNACHFRHALALDERRVKFIPEYFAEVNARHSKIRSLRSAISDVKEVWFAGSHADVGGISRGYNEVVSHSEVDAGSYPVHAGNVPLLWMRREAAAHGLVFKPEEFTWDPEDIDLGREDTMTGLWKFLEILPIRHQVSFSGTGKHEQRRHRSRPRSVIPDQKIHSSILSGDVYTPLANLRDSVDIPTVPRRVSDKLWTTELPDEGASTCLLTSLLSDEQKTLESLERVLFLLNSNLTRLNYRGLHNGQAETVPRPQWSVGEQFGFNKVALTVIYDVLSNFSVSEEQLKDVRDSLCVILSSADPPGIFYILRFSTRHETLRRRFIAHDEVIGALMRALERTAKSPNENLFPLVMGSLRYLIDHDDIRGNVINQLSARSDESETGQTRLSVALEVKASSQLVASLKMIASFAQYRPDLCQELKPKIFELAERERGLVGSAAVEALAALNASLTGDIHFPNFLGYLGNTLPPLDAEVGGTSPPDNTDNSPPVLQDNNAEVGSTSLPDNTGDLLPVLQDKSSGQLDEGVMVKLVSTIESRDAHERTAATLTLLKLCRYSTILRFCSRVKTVHIFMRQLERKKTSLLAAYALKTCLEQGMVTHSDDFDRAAQLIVAMLDKGWFDDAVGRVEGTEIFSGLMTIGDLRRRVVDLKIVPALMKKLEGGERHDVRMSLLCLDILERDHPAELTPIVEQSIANLKANGKKIQMKGVKILAALAQISAGEEAIKPHVIDIVKMLLPSPGSPPRPRSRLVYPTAALYDLCKNETLRKAILASPEFRMLKDHRRAGTLHPQVPAISLGN